VLRGHVTAQVVLRLVVHDDGVEAVEAGTGPPGALTTEEREELRRLRRENKTLQMEREILRKAAAFFAREAL